MNFLLAQSQDNGVAIEYNDAEGDPVEFRLLSQSYNNPHAYCRVGYSYDPNTGQNIPQIDPDTDCFPLSFGITPRGNVYLHRPFAGIRRSPIFAIQNETLRIAVTDLSTGKSTEKEIIVQGSPPRTGHDCSSHSPGSRAHYECLYQQELPALTQNTHDPSLLASLPRLVQSSSNYRLIFREEFNGTGLDSLDLKIWKVKGINGNNCPTTVENGYYAFTQNDSLAGCSNQLLSQGKFEYKYGYLEVKVKLPLKQADQHSNFAFVLWNRYAEQTLPQAYYAILRRYDLLGFNSSEDYYSYRGGEMDIFEYVAPNLRSYRNRTLGHSHGHTYSNWHNGEKYIPTLHALPKRYDVGLVFCGTSTERFIPYLQTDSRCAGFYDSSVSYDDSLVEVTFALEWTPHGYRRFHKVEGVDDSLVLQPTNRMGFGVDSARVVEQADGSWAIEKDTDSNYYSSWKSGEDSAVRDFLSSHFHYQDQDLNNDGVADDPDPQSFLLQYNVFHTPAFIEIVNWGDSNISENRAYIDYIRVFQPVDKYASMKLTPVYQ